MPSKISIIPLPRNNCAGPPYINSRDLVADLAPRLRESDKKEVYASGGLTPERALMASVSASELAWCALLDGTPEIMWGAAHYDYNITTRKRTGVVWLLSSEEMYKIPGRFIEESHVYVNEMLTEFDLLFNYVHANNIKSQQWLEMLGFEAKGRNETYGFAQEPFILYSRSA